MIDNSSNFYGFGVDLGGPTSSSDIQKYLDFYNQYSGTGDVPEIISQTIPKQSGGVDEYGNNIVKYNFTTTEIPAGTVDGYAWYSWLIPDDSIGNNRQVAIDVSYGSDASSFSTKITTSNWYSYSVTNPGGLFEPGTYRLYVTYTDQSFRLDNTLTNIYFKGGTVS